MFERTSVNVLLDNPQEIVHLKDSFNVEDISVEGLAYHVQGPAVFEVDMAHTGDGVLVYGTVSLPTRVACVRCLEEFDFELFSHFEVLFFLKPTFDEEGDELPSVDEMGYSALFDELYAALRVEAPFAPICGDDCKGLCPVCGANLNEESCDCSNKPDPHHPFAGLADLIKPED